MCGIFGTITNDVKNIDLTKIHLMGVLNEERGTDSCGLFLDGSIYAGFDKDLKNYRDFALNMSEAPVKIPCVLGHTRQASPGAKITIENVHPFGFGFNKKKGFKFVGAHNGTLYNKEELAKEFGVEVKDGEREKIDSEILLECIYKSKNFKVLEKYHGAAALSFYNIETNKMYLYSGASGEYTTKNPKLERPLHVYVESETVLHYSSEANPLFLIGGNLDNVFQIDNNFVYEFTPGDFNNYKKYPIDRSNMKQKNDSYYGYSNYSNYGNYGRYGGYSYYDDFEEVTPTHLDIYNNLVKQGEHTKFKKISYKYYKSVPPLGITGEESVTYSVGGLYYTNSKKDSVNLNTPIKNVLADGIYIYISTAGYFKIADTIEECKINLRRLNDNFFNMKTLEFITSEKDINWTDRDAAYIDYFMLPSDVENNIDTFKTEVMDEYLHFFERGVKLKSCLDFKICKSKKASFKDLSFMCEEVMLTKENVAYKDGVKFTGTFENLYYIYSFTEGKIDTVELKEKIESFKIFDYRYE